LWRQIDDLHADIRPDYFRPVVRAREEWDKMLSSASAGLLVAEAADGRLIGAVTIRVFDTPADPSMVPRRRAHVDALVVDRRHRRTGVGTRLMDAAGAWGRTRGAVELVLTVWSGNAAAEAFYRRLGYREVSRALRRNLAPTSDSESEG
jgi:ribosomal protein S18 acetylase RimI-like enzyme